MKYKVSFVIYLAAFLLQGTFLNLISVYNVTPNLILCLTVAFALLYHEEYHAVIFGTVFGLLADICYMPYAGVSALGYFLIALGVMLAADLVSSENFASILMCMAASNVFFTVFMWVVYFFLGSPVHIRVALATVPVSLIYNLAVVSLLYVFMIRGAVRFREDNKYFNRQYRYK